ncbi:MAG: RIP metalloprotease RseP [Bacteroidetes bacterium]|nr:RIP metalloprotease RseP [Bacteroidota bacterium]
MGIVVMISQFLLALTILVGIHELGHFLAARMFKIRVDKFYLFFDFLFPFQDKMNFALFKKKIGDTEYGLGWFPMGGYVNINGMVDETTNADQLPAEPQPYEYRSKPHWQKIIVILGGIIFNIVLGIIIYTFWLQYFQKEYLPVQEMKQGIFVHEAGEKIGFRNGDRILSVNGKNPVRYEDCFPMDIFFGGNYMVERMENGQMVEKKIEISNGFHKQIRSQFFEPYYHQIRIMGLLENGNAEKAGIKPDDVIEKVNGIAYANFSEFKAILDSNRSKTISIKVKRKEASVDMTCMVDTAGKIGIAPFFVTNKSKYAMKDYGMMEAFSFGISECFKTFALQGIALVKMGKGEISAKENIGGFGSIAKVFGKEWNWSKFWILTAMLSMGLAFMNLLPIPGLDGGYFVMIVYEWIVGKPINPKVMDVLQRIGFMLILALMIFANGNDLIKALPESIRKLIGY